MTLDLDQLIRDADPARDLGVLTPDPDAAREAIGRGAPRRHRNVAGIFAVALSLSVLAAVLAVIVISGPRSPHPPVQSPGAVSGHVSARAVTSAHYCWRRGGKTITPCSIHPHAGLSPIGGTPGTLVDVRFVAPIAVDGARSYYQAKLTLPRSAGCDAGALDGPTRGPLTVGQHGTIQFFVPASCPGRIHVVLKYIPRRPTPPGLAHLSPEKRRAVERGFTLPNTPGSVIGRSTLTLATQ